jgi:hypothetical protein
VSGEGKAVERGARGQRVVARFFREWAGGRAGGREGRGGGREVREKGADGERETKEGERGMSFRGS